ncbi:hypothetical protein KJ359_010903 [Pestalotiopsis sp. 9143b]|nr:hypothetical protein KJ359_010903 [Pestalotiopsis sp. 9143b]
MAGTKSTGRPAMVEDADEEGNVNPNGSRRSARSTITTRTGSPMKQQSNTSRKKSSSSSAQRLPPTVSPNESDSTEQASSSSSRHKSKEKRSSRKGKEVVVPDRPRMRTSQTTPAAAPRNIPSDDPAHYGIPHRSITATSTSGRPRAHSRPQSYYNVPPLSQSAYYPHQASPLSYGVSPQWGGGPLLGTSPFGTSPMSHPNDYFGGRAEYAVGNGDRLASRFESRPRSSMGNYGTSFEDRYDFEAPSPHARQDSVHRKPSLSKRTTKDSEDRRTMPPPPRPQTTGARQHFKPPPSQSHRKSVNFDEDDSDVGTDIYDDIPRGATVDFLKEMPIRSRRPSQGTVRRQSLGLEYPVDDYAAIEPDRPKARRQDRRSVSYSIEDKMQSASRYQNAVTGTAPAPAPLTPDNLRRVKNSTSSRSTRSSASRDESSFRQSETTKTTRSGSNDDDITIKVPSGAVVEYGGAKIRCANGGELTVGRSGGSDRGTVFDDDLRSHARRTERSAMRPRASSQSVHTRRPRAIMSPNPHDHAADYPDNPGYYGVAPAYAPYPASSFGDWDDDHIYDRHY